MRTRHGFTLVELFVVIAIIGLLVALLIPAVQSAREAARKTSCVNNRKQTALAILNHASAHDQLPGLLRQDVWNTWRLTILPFLEEGDYFGGTLSDLYLTRPPSGTGRQTSTKPAAVPSFLCPSTPGTPLLVPELQIAIRDHETQRLRVLCDGLAAMQNDGISIVTLVLGQDLSLLKLEPGAWSGTAHGDLGGQHGTGGQRFKDDILPRLFHPAKLQWITDGTSKTILVREQAGLPRVIDAMGDYPDRPANWIRGPSWRYVYNEESGLWLVKGLTFNARKVPAINGSNVSGIYSFHPGGAHASMCDGAVRFLAEGITHEVLFSLASRSGDDASAN